MISPGIGHNSRLIELEKANEELTQQVEVLRSRDAVRERLIREQQEEIDRARRLKQIRDERDACEDVILNSHLPGPAKLASIRIIKSLGVEERAIVTRSALAKAASVKTETHVSRIVAPLLKSGIVRSTPLGGGPVAYHIPSLPDLQAAVEAYARSIGSHTVAEDTFSTEHPSRETHALQSTRHKGQMLSRARGTDALQSTGSAPQSTVGCSTEHSSDNELVEPKKKNFPPRPPLSPHTPLSPPIVPPIEKEGSYTTHSSVPRTARDELNLTGPAPAKVRSRPINADLENLAKRLADASGPALADPVTAPGLMAMTTPLMWVEQGCDIERDILPTIRAKSAVGRVASIRSWNYFTQAITQAKAIREQGLPVLEMVQNGNGSTDVGGHGIARSGKSPQNVPNWHNRIDPRGSMRDS